MVGLKEVTLLFTVFLLQYCASFNIARNYGAKQADVNIELLKTRLRQILGPKELDRPDLDDVIGFLSDISSANEESSNKEIPLELLSGLSGDISIKNNGFNRGGSPLETDPQFLSEVPQRPRQWLFNDGQAINSFRGNRVDVHHQKMSPIGGEKLSDLLRLSRDGARYSGQYVGVGRRKRAERVSRRAHDALVYSLLNEDFVKSIKRHAVGSDKHIRKLLEALATIKDIMDKEKAAERQRAARQPTSLLGPRMGFGDTPPVVQYPPSNDYRSDIDDRSRSNNDIDQDLSPRYEYINQVKPEMEQTKVDDYERNQASDRHNRKEAMNLATRTSQKNLEDRSNSFYHPDFNPTGW